MGMQMVKTHLSSLIGLTG